MLLDSNIFIYAIQAKYQALQQWCQHTDIAASEITLLEVLGYHQLNAQDKEDFIALFACTEIYPITQAVLAQT